MYSEWRRGIFLYTMKICSYFQADFWTIEIEKLRFLGGDRGFSKGFLGMVDSRRFVTRIIELRTMHSRRDLESNGKIEMN